MLFTLPQIDLYVRAKTVFSNKEKQNKTKQNICFKYQGCAMKKYTQELLLGCYSDVTRSSPFRFVC